MVARWVALSSHSKEGLFRDICRKLNLKKCLMNRGELVFVTISAGPLM